MEPVQASVQKERVYQPPTHGRQMRGKTILVVDDESAILSVLCETFQYWGCRVMRANNGKEGLEQLKTKHVDGIILDLDMPVMDGATMLDELRWQSDCTPVILISGGADVQRMRMMQKEGAQGFLVKPFSVETLRAECERCFVPDRKREPFDLTEVSAPQVAARHRVVA